MLWASLYITICSAKNRIRTRLRRLREPKYLVGAIVGVAYVYLTIFGRTWMGSRTTPRRAARTPPPVVSAAAFGAAGPVFVGLAMMVLMVVAWLFPSESGLLEFTEAEVQFLFPAPVSRRQLLVHRLMRSQISLLFAAVVPALVFPSASGASRLKVAASIWVIFVTMKVHFTGITLARASLGLRSADARRRQWAAPALMLAAVAIVGGALARSFLSQPPSGLSDAYDRLAEVTASGLPHIILWPFVALVRPVFVPWAPSPGPYLLALAGALAVLAANVVWVLGSDAAFQEAAAQAEARRAAKQLRTMPAPRARTTTWTLALSGRPETLFLWKNVMQMLRETNIATFFRYGAPFLAMVVAMSASFLRHSEGVAALLGIVALGGALAAVVMGPQLARTDLRQDLLHLELLKTWPIRASAVIRGEMLWPVTMLTLVAWAAIGVAMTFWTPAFSPATAAWRVSAALAAALLAPGLVAAQYTIHNAAAVMFPAWVPLGTSRPRGIDAMGQRLIMFAGVLIGLALMMVPGVIAGGILWLVLYGIAGPVVLVPAAALCTAIVMVEVLTATEALGPVFERLDLTGIERSE